MLIRKFIGNYRGKTFLRKGSSPEPLFQRLLAGFSMDKAPKNNKTAHIIKRLVHRKTKTESSVKKSREALFHKSFP